jgi:hypothetical protein
MTIADNIKVHDQETKNAPLPAQKMHKVVWILVGVFTAIALSFPVAMLRVSKEVKFKGSHVISLTEQGALQTKK